MFTLLVAAVFSVLAFWVGLKVGFRHGKAAPMEWRVRTHTADSLSRIPVEGKNLATVVDAAFVRTDLPNSTSKME